MLCCGDLRCHLRINTVLITISDVRVPIMHSTDFLFILHDCCSQNRIGGFSEEDRDEGQRPDSIIYQSSIKNKNLKKK